MRSYIVLVLIAVLCMAPSSLFAFTAIQSVTEDNAVYTSGNDDRLCTQETMTANVDKDTDTSFARMTGNQTNLAITGTGNLDRIRLNEQNVSLQNFTSIVGGAPTSTVNEVDVNYAAVTRTAGAGPDTLVTQVIYDKRHMDGIACGSPNACQTVELVAGYVLDTGWAIGTLYNLAWGNGEPTGAMVQRGSACIGVACGGDDLGGGITFPLAPYALETGDILATSANFKPETAPTCASGDYRLYVDSGTHKFKVCEDGTVTDLVP